jgi:hypothetical protein
LDELLAALKAVADAARVVNRHYKFDGNTDLFGAIRALDNALDVLKGEK